MQLSFGGTEENLRLFHRRSGRERGFGCARTFFLGRSVKRLRRFSADDFNVIIFGQNARERLLQQTVLRGDRPVAIQMQVVWVPVSAAAAMGSNGRPRALRSAQTPPRSRAQDGILSAADFLLPLALGELLCEKNPVLEWLLALSNLAAAVSPS